MIITCPNCSSQFNVNAQALGEEGRKVRCGSCGHDWHQMPLADPPPEAAGELVFEETPAQAPPEAAPAEPPAAPEVPPPPPPPPPPPEPPQAEQPVAAAEAIKAARKVPPPQKKRAGGRVGRIVMWLVFVFLFAAILTGTYRYRQLLVDRWPAATGIYEAVGISVVPPASYSFRIEKSKLKFQYLGKGVNRVLVVRGTVTNSTAKPRPSPSVRIDLLNDKGSRLKRHELKITKSTMGPGEVVAFEAKIARPPATASNVQLNLYYPKKGSGAG